MFQQLKFVWWILVPNVGNLFHSFHTFCHNFLLCFWSKFLTVDLSLLIIILGVLVEIRVLKRSCKWYVTTRTFPFKILFPPSRPYSSTKSNLFNHKRTPLKFIEYVFPRFWIFRSIFEIRKKFVWFLADPASPSTSQ